MPKEGKENKSDQLFDAVIYLSIVVCFLLGVIIAVTSTVITIDTKDSQTAMVVSSGIMFLIAIILSSFMIYIKSWSSHGKK